MHANEEHLLLLFAHANAGFGVSDLPRVVLEGSLKHSHNPTGVTSLQPAQDLALKLLHIAVQPRAPWHEVHDLPLTFRRQASDLNHIRQWLPCGLCLAKVLEVHQNLAV